MSADVEDCIPRLYQVSNATTDQITKKGVPISPDRDSFNLHQSIKLVTDNQNVGITNIESLGKCGDPEN